MSSQSSIQGTHLHSKGPSQFTKTNNIITPTASERNSSLQSPVSEGSNNQQQSPNEVYDFTPLTINCRKNKKI